MFALHKRRWFGGIAHQSQRVVVEVALEGCHANLFRCGRQRIERAVGPVRAGPARRGAALDTPQRHRRAFATGVPGLFGVNRQRQAGKWPLVEHGLHRPPGRDHPAPQRGPAAPAQPGAGDLWCRHQPAQCHNAAAAEVEQGQFTAATNARLDAD